MTIYLPHRGWRPRRHQLKLWKYLRAGGKRAIEVAHRRFGKDEICLHWTARAALARIGTYWHMLPEASQARKAIWEAVNPNTGRRRIDEAFPREIREKTREDEMFIRFINGSTWQVLGSDNYNSLVGAPPVGVVFSEWALANPAAWAYIRPILAENGGWALFITTPRGRNHAHKMLRAAKTYPDWYAEVHPVSLTEAIPADVLRQELQELQDEHGEQAGQALYDQEYECSFDTVVLGAVYGQWIADAEKAGRVKTGIYDPDLPVFTAWDLGFDDSTAIWWWQRAAGEIRLIDYYENARQDIKHYAEQVLGVALNEWHTPQGGKAYRRGAVIPGLGHRASYRYERHYVPHDAAYKLLAAGGRSIVEQAKAMGLVLFPLAATSQQNLIAATRALLRDCWVDERACAQGIEALKAYRFEYDEEKKTFRSTPLHNWASHGADAFEIIAQVRQMNIEPERKPAPRFLHEATAEEIFWGDIER